MVNVKELKLGDELHYADWEMGVYYESDGKVVKLKNGTAIMACDGKHRWDKDLRLTIDHLTDEFFFRKGEF